ncbi:unnamed protein product [Protopolystoma xenopodis]|uniref:Uncharacterized protein n=1 Tax=Protopolystoma xenopodis TaxID=117903 RepID=A0A448WLK1_9PLAT|nr:unnamed protein product [Protopolystoma xenopodis]
MSRDPYETLVSCASGPSDATPSPLPGRLACPAFVTNSSARPMRSIHTASLTSLNSLHDTLFSPLIGAGMIDQNAMLSPWCQVDEGAWWMTLPGYRISTQQEAEMQVIPLLFVLPSFHHLHI